MKTVAKRDERSLPFVSPAKFLLRGFESLNLPGSQGKFVALNEGSIMNHHLAAKLVEPGQGRVVNVMGNELRLILSSIDTGGVMELVELNAVPGVGIPPHMHTREDEVFMLLEGQVEFYVNGQTRLLGPGATLLGARNVPHGYQVVGDKPCRMYFTVTPAQLEPMFDQLAALSPPEPESISRICGKFGIEILPA
jgi:quercetin dioxygenase-like cupin family protein